MYKYEAPETAGGVLLTRISSGFPGRPFQSSWASPSQPNEAHPQHPSLTALCKDKPISWDVVQWLKTDQPSKIWVCTWFLNPLWHFTSEVPLLGLWCFAILKQTEKRREKGKMREKSSTGSPNLLCTHCSYGVKGHNYWTMKCWIWQPAHTLLRWQVLNSPFPGKKTVLLIL